MATEERTFAGELRGRRATAGLSQAELASMVGVSGSAIGNWERGEDEPSRENVLALERALELDPGSLSRHLGYEPARPEMTHDDLMDFMRSVQNELRDLRSAVEELRRGD